MRWFGSRQKAGERLKSVVTRARAVEISPGRHAVGYGPDGPLWGDQTAQIIRFNDYISR